MDSTAQIQIKLTTKHIEYAVPDLPIAVPANIDVNGLNKLVNHLIEETSPQNKTIEFDFLVSGDFLLLPLKEHLEDRNISPEQITVIEYLERLAPPKPHDCLMHDDWVSAVQVAGNWILTGTYDNSLHLWTSKGKHKLSIPGHTGPIKGVSWVDLDETNGTFISISQDQTAMMWQWNIPSNSVEVLKTFRGHDRAVDSLGISKDNSHTLATGSWDTNIHLWKTEINDTQDDPENNTKKLKTNQGSKIQKKIKPFQTIKGHREAVSGIIWTDKDAELISCSWDHTIRLWDAETAGIKTELQGNKAFLDLDWSPLNRSVITASVDRYVRLYDPRSSEGSLVKNTYVSHNLWVSSVRWSKIDPLQFISVAYDNQAKLWDTRSCKACLYDLTGHEDKVLCCDWSRPDLMVSGGADNTVRIFKNMNVPK